VELDSEEYDSDNVQPQYDSEDDTPMTDIWPEFNSATDMADPEFEVGMKFSDCKVFRAVVREQFIKRNRDVVFVRKLRKTNPGTTTKVQLFQRLYVCLGAYKVGFIAGCRPIIGLDGCFLKGVYGGQFLVAV
ncbi:PREDICTED: LOC109756472 isoform, partial [Prunus dulcis]